MKKIVLIALLIFATGNLFAQTDGISYQAVIINPTIQEIPGADVSGNILQNTTVSLRFTIIDANNAVEYQEVQTTITDQYGMINLLIGIVDHDAFNLISWDATKKELKVEIDFKGGTNYVELGREELTFLPYASHRNITASGTLKVDETTFLNGELTVEEATYLNNALNVNNNSASNLTGDLIVGGAAILEGATNLNSSLNVNNKSISKLSGALKVGKNLEISDLKIYDEDASTKLNGALTVVGPTELDGLKSAKIETNTLLVAQDPDTEVLTSTILNGSNTLNGENELIGANLLQGVNALEETNNLTGNNTFKSGDEVDDANTLIGKTILSGKNTIGNSLTDITTIKGELSVNTANQVKITSTLSGVESDIDKYPLLIEGDNQGVVIKVVASEANNNNNFISFWDTNNPNLLGRIEGQTSGELGFDAKFAAKTLNLASKLTSAYVKSAKATVEAVFSGAEVGAAATSATGCFGFGACVAAPVPSLIISKAAKTILKIANGIKVGLMIGTALFEVADFASNMDDNLGVTFVSGNGDYAEYIPKENISENFIPGELVGIKNGLVTKDVWGAEKIMIVSTQPIVLGNMPQPNNEINSEKIAFMGQVPVTVVGTVIPGDYILPNVLTSNFARAVHPKDMKTRDYKNVAGVVWNIISENSGISIVNVAVGINTNDLTEVVYQQEEELKVIRAKVTQLQLQMEQVNTVRAKLVPGYAEATGTNTTLKSNEHQEDSFVHKEEENTGNVIDGTAYGNGVVYFEIPNELLEQGIALARQVTLEAYDDESSLNKLLSQYETGALKVSTVNAKSGIAKKVKNNLNDDPFWQKMDTNPAFNEEIIHVLKSSIDKAYHTHNKDAKNFNEFKIRKD
jgi:hypothetical protein